MKRLAFWTLLLVSPLALAGKGTGILHDHWIVNLEDPPAVHFAGGEHIEIQQDGSRVGKALLPTAPAVTGHSRLKAHSPAVKAYTALLDQRQNEVLESAGIRLQRTIVPRHRYRLVANGFSVRMTAAEAAEVALLPGVASVEPVEIHDLQLDAGPSWINALPSQQAAAGVSPVRGEDVVIGILDSGIQWDHPYFDPEYSGDYEFSNPYSDYLGECSHSSVNCNDKLVGVYEMTTEDARGEDLDGHGTHVAATAAGNSLVWTIELPGGQETLDAPGVAPRAHIISYRVCYHEHPDDSDLDGRCTGDAIMAGLEQAITDEVDLINYSIGGSPGDPWQTIGSGQTGLQEKFLNLREAGIVPVAAAGNDGPGPGTVTSTGNAPWVIGVGNISHDRRFANVVTDLSGGEFQLDDLIGVGSTEGTDNLPIVHAADYGNALCGEGEAELQPTCDDLTGSTNPFAPGTFDGKIVVCDRGEYGRVEKGYNVMEAGAAGMILANTPEWGESINSDAHCLPGTHVGAEEGELLRDWLASGNNHSGSLSGESIVRDSSFGSQLSISSGRGPEAFAPEVMKPNLVAPGTDIIAAMGEDGLGILSGSSMASPHVAGAVALLLSKNPDWTVSMVHSALETTATTSGLVTETGAPATIVDRGAGLINVSQALKAGLYLNVTGNQFRNAGSSNAGPGQLNLAGMIREECEFECSFTRTVTAMQAGSWEVSGEGPADITVEPAQFSLQAGQTQTLEITASATHPDALGGWTGGRVVLQPDSADMATQYLTVGFKAMGAILPDSLDFEVESNRGQTTVSLEDVVAMPEAIYRSSPLVRPDDHQIDLPEDSDPSDPFDESSGTHVVWLDVPEDTMMIYAETLASTAPDIDLYVGRDDFGSGTPEQNSVRCQGISPDELEQCIVNNPEPGQWWVLIQNWQGSNQSTDSVQFRTAVLVDTPDPSLVATGPASHSGGSMDLRLAWDQDAMERDEPWMGVVSLGTDPSRPGNVGQAVVNLTRTASASIDHTTLVPGKTHTLVLPPGERHDRLYVDVPPGAEHMTVSVEGSGLDVGLSRLDFDALAGFEPDTPQAPSGFVAQGSVPGAGLELEVPGDQLQAGRWYVVLDSPAGSETTAGVTVELEVGEPVFSRFGLWSPQLRTTNQGFSWNRAGAFASILWYTYDEAGLPIFYLAEGPLLPDESHWQGELYRFTSNNERQIPSRIGNVSLTFIDDFDQIFSWQLFGHHGSEYMGITSVPTCPEIDGEQKSYSADWHTPGVAKGGSSVVITTGGQAVIRYYYDDDQESRWVLGDSLDDPGGPIGDSFELDAFHFEGFCPWCEPVDPQSQVVGSYAIVFDAENRAGEVVDMDLPAPLNQSFFDASEIRKLSSRVDCLD